MTEHSELNVIIEMYPTEHGGRAIMPDLKSGQYRPHIVINKDPKQTYLGVAFFGGPESFSADDEVSLQLRKLYDKIDYSGLIRGTTFLIKEGANTVGEGVVL